jgi:hypothetical protein
LPPLETGIVQRESLQAWVGRRPRDWRHWRQDQRRHPCTSPSLVTLSCICMCDYTNSLQHRNMYSIMFFYRFILCIFLLALLCSTLLSRLHASVMHCLFN